MPPKIMFKRGPDRGFVGGRSVQAPKKGHRNAIKTSRDRRPSSSSLSSASIDPSDDDGYSAVDDVSDSDDDDEAHVFAAEEKHMISDERQAKRHAAPGSPWPSSSDLDDDDDNEKINANANYDNYSDDGLNFNDNGIASWNGFTSESEEVAPVQAHAATGPVSTDTPVERHVRFTGVPDSESDSDKTEEVDDFFTDIFIAQDSLDSNFRREIEQDNGDDSSVSATCWGHTGGGGMEEDSGDDGPYAVDDDFPTLFGDNNINETHDLHDEALHSIVPDLPSQEDDAESDGYESDGETTEEDEPQLVFFRKSGATLRGVSGEASDSKKPASFCAPRPSCLSAESIKKPFKKPIVVMNPVTRKMMVITPQKKKRFNVILDPTRSPPDSLSFPTTTESSPIMSNPGYLMLSAMSSANFLVGGMSDFQTIGPAEAFFPASSDLFGGDDSEDSWLMDAEADGEDAEEKNLNIEDFLDFGDGDSDGEGRVDKTDDGDNSVATPSRRASAASDINADADIHPLLSHLTNNADAVGAFRRNQVNQQRILNGQATHDSLAFSNSLYHGTLCGIKHGSLRGAHAPLTPERRLKKALAKSPTKNAIQKRKHSDITGEDNGNPCKKRAISDLRLMPI